MKKIFNRIKEELMIIFVFFLTIPTRVLANSIVEPVMQEDYGIQKPPSDTLLWNITRKLIIPITLLVGLMVYLKKSKSSKKKKILVTVSAILVTVVLCHIITFLIDYFL